jgi:uncharacterized membrane protein
MSWNPNQQQDPFQQGQSGGNYQPGNFPQQAGLPVPQTGFQEGGPPPQQGAYQPGNFPQQGGFQPGNQPPQQGSYQPGNFPQQGGFQPGGFDQQGGYQPGAYQQQPDYQPQAAAYAVPRPTNPNGPTSIGLDANVAAGLSYLLLILGGLIFYFGEKQNHFVRFNAVQSILLDVVALVVFFAFFILQFIFYATSVLAALGLAALCLGFLALFGGLAVVFLLMLFAFEGKTFRLPVLARYADKYSTI